jgi:hypothetical protein
MSKGGEGGSRVDKERTGLIAIGKDFSSDNLY